MVRSNTEIGVSSHVLFDAGHTRVVLNVLLVDVAAAAAAATAVDAVITTTGGGTAEAQVAAADETDRVVIDITLFVFACAGLLLCVKNS